MATPMKSNQLSAFVPGRFRRESIADSWLQIIERLNNERRPLDGRVGGCQPRNGNTERGTTHIVEPGRMAKLDRAWFAAVLTTDTNFQIGAGLPAELDAHRHQLAYPFSI